MCGDFKCSRSALMGLNIFYILLSFILIGVATHWKTSAEVDSLPIIGGITFSGVVLLFVAILGLVATTKHHQVMLFVYMLILALLFIIQFSVACACLSVSHESRITMAEKGWEKADNITKFEAEKLFTCCGFNTASEGVNCSALSCNGEENSHKLVSDTSGCPPCKQALEDVIDEAFQTAGLVGLLFSFTELVALVYAFKFRRQIRELSQVPS